MTTRAEIAASLNYLKENWQMQNNYSDSKTKFIYTSDTIEEVRYYSEKNRVDFNYALHRWYNFNCAKLHEEIFIKYGAIKEVDIYHKTIDFYISGIPFDLKTTYFPKAIKDISHYDLKKRSGKNNLIKWLYENQSKQGRFHLENRLFLVCEDLVSKSNFVLIEEKIKNFIEYSQTNGFNELQLDNSKIVFSDIILVRQ